MRSAGLMRTVVIAVVMSGAAMLAPRVWAQQGSSFPSMSPQSSGKMPSASMGGQQDDNNSNTRDPLAQQQEARRARAAMDERQRKMQEDTAKLLQLAEQLKAEMEKTNKFQMSLEVVKKAEEIEKLARDVKNRMKG